MPFTIPNIESSPTYDGQSVPDNTDWVSTTVAESGNGVVIGCVVAASVTPNMTINTTAGSVMVNGTQVVMAANASVGIGAASSTDRRDLISASVAPNYTSSLISVTQGAACGTANWQRTSSGLPPVKPALASNNVALAEVYLVGTGSSASTSSIAAGNIIDKRTIIGGTPGSLLARTQYAPTNASSYGLTAIATGLTALDTTNLSVTFIGPPSGSVLVRQTAFCHGPASAATKIIFGVVSSTASPGTLVGVGGLMWITPTATLADNGVINTMEQLVTGLTSGNTYTWYFAGAYSGTASSVTVQGGSTNTTAPTGAPAIIEVWAA